MKIALCPGHHKNARGAVNKKYGLNEYDEATKVIEYAEPLLRGMGHEVEKIIGRLGTKIALINDGDFDVAIDYHFNADYDHLDPDDLDDSRGHGCMVVYCPQNKVYGERESADYLRRQQANTFSAAMAPMLDNRNLGGRQGWWWSKLENGKPIYRDGFLTKTNCPAFIPEPGYIDNNRFAEMWLVSDRHAQLAEALAVGISNTFGG
jgi:hypothetical protein